MTSKEANVLFKQEIKPTMIEPLKGKQTLKAAELQDGDIICFQHTSDKKTENGRVADKASQEAYVLPIVANTPPSNDD